VIDARMVCAKNHVLDQNTFRWSFDGIVLLCKNVRGEIVPSP
jgi:hypothetical protein